MSEQDFEQFKRERDAALLSLDRHQIAAYCRKYRVTMPTNEEVFWRAIHKARTANTALPMEARTTSKRWLIARGSEPLDDGDVPT